MSVIAHYGHPGPRDSYEDACAAWTFRSWVPLQTNAALAVLADGVGGQAGGEVASQTICLAIGAKLAGPITTDWADEQVPAEQVLTGLREACAQCSELIHAQAAATPGLRGMASTVVVFLALHAMGYVAWAGDSRLYLLRQGRLRRLTRDHSLIQKAIDEGVADEQASASLPAHVIYRCLGIGDATGVDTAVVRLVPNDMIIMTSDGITDVLTDSQIEHILSRQLCEGLDLAAICHVLVHKALEAGTTDNATVVAYSHRHGQIPKSLSAKTMTIGYASELAATARAFSSQEESHEQRKPLKLSTCAGERTCSRTAA